MTTDVGYKEGLRDGKIHAIEDMQVVQNERLKEHNGRISKLERVSYIILGIAGVMQFGPSITSMFT